MSKRRCPFDNMYQGPVKKQIIDKKGTVAMASQMKVIYERTMRLLFEGANTAHSDHLVNHFHGAAEPDTTRYRQTFLDSRCQLHINGSIECQPGELCSSRLTEPLIQCSFCDRSPTNGVSKECSKCQEKFCQACCSESFNNFSDHFVCLGCG